MATDEGRLRAPFLFSGKDHHMKRTLKALVEKRNEKIQEMRAITDAAAEEVRALSADEEARFKELEAEVEALKGTIDAMKHAEDLIEGDPGELGSANDGKEAEDVRAFAAYIRADAQTRATDVNLTTGANGAVIPTTIADRIIKRIYEISPIMEKAMKFPGKGKIAIPYYDEENGGITVEYVEEFTDGTSTVGSLKTIVLGGFLARALTKVSRSMMNSTDIDLVGFVVEDMAKQFARWLEREGLIGTKGKIEGCSGIKNIVTAAKADEVTLDELIDLQDSVIDFYQANALWVMNRKTRTKIRKLKDADGKPLLQQDITAPFGYVLLGKPVYTSDNVATMAAGARTIYYGDFEGLGVHFNEEPNTQILQEKFADQHAIGALGFIEVDAKVYIEQALAALEMKGTASS